MTVVSQQLKNEVWLWRSLISLDESHLELAVPRF